MPHKSTPSSVMYAQFKRLGISNRDAATLLLNTQLTFDGRPLEARIAESSQLSRRIVHTEPGDIPRSLFNDFHISCPRIARQLVERHAVERHAGDLEAAAHALFQTLSGAPIDLMAQALNQIGVDSAILRNMAPLISRTELDSEQDRFTLLTMVFAITGCLGNPRTASIVTIDYATNVLGADLRTAQTVVNALPSTESRGEELLGLVRMVDGSIRAGSKLHVLNPAGTEIGLLPEGRHIIADVGQDASRRHARIWREGDRWLIEDLGSTNGTAVVSGASGESIAAPSAAPSVGSSAVGPSDAACPSAASSNGSAQQPVEIRATDIIHLGADTQFMVLPLRGD